MGLEATKESMLIPKFDYNFHWITKLSLSITEEDENVDFSYKKLITSTCHILWKFLGYH